MEDPVVIEEDMLLDGPPLKKTTVIDVDGKDEISGDFCVDDDEVSDDVARIIHSNEDVDMIYDGINNDDNNIMDKNVTSVTIRIEAEEGEELE